MKVAIDSDKFVTDVAALKALTPSNNDIKYVESEDKMFYFFASATEGDHAPDSGEGYWHHDCSAKIYEAVDDNYDFVGNGKTEITTSRIIEEASFGLAQTDGLYNIDFAITEFIRDDVKRGTPVNEVDYVSVRNLTPTYKEERHLLKEDLLR